jgi:exodeoxyribonuclease-3
MPFTVATWNVNSIRSRLDSLVPWLDAARPDVVCLQETKVQDHDFPAAPIESVGYHLAFRGQKTYNGVAILSTAPIERVRAGFDDDGPADEARLIAGVVRGVTLVNAYAPQGRDPENEMYAYKLAWFPRLRAYLETNSSPEQPLLLMGDLNVAPESIDVWDPKRLLGHVCFNPQVTEALEGLKSWGLVDVFRAHVPEPGQYTYYDYRSKDAIAGGKGWRVDHMLATRRLAEASVKAWIDLGPRRGERPSDHAPLLATFELAAS